MLRVMRRMVCLDRLRGVLACYVMLSHTLPFAPLPAWLLWLFQHGGAAVDVFFILSGLVIVQLAVFLPAAAIPIARVARIYRCSWWCSPRLAEHPLAVPVIRVARTDSARIPTG
jgi:peptidoglycan/LPS O-acetylase OafA/YrhL